MQSYTILCIDCKAASDNRWSTFTCMYYEYILPRLSICNCVIIT